MASEASTADMAMAEATPDQPVRREDRIVSLDLIRGVAVLGILWANITAFGHPQAAYAWPEMLPGGGNAADDAMWLFQYIFIDGKLRGLFTLLFGAGVYLFMERAWARGSSRWLQARRLFWLGAIGLTHFFFIWYGDILFLYAMSGLLSLMFLKRSIKTQFWLGISLYLLGGALFTLMLGGQALMEANPQIEGAEGVLAFWEEMRAGVPAKVAVYSTGSLTDIWGYALAEYPKVLANYPILAITETLPLMLIGMALFRWGFFEGALDRAKTIRWSWIGIAVSAALSLPLGLWVMDQGFPQILTQFVFAGPSHFIRLPMILGFAGLLTAYAPGIVATGIGQRLVAAGRAAFTNYLGTSVAMMFVFHGWALGLFGKLHRLEMLVVVFAAWAVMLLWSKPWLERYRYGPLEWLWRCLTYWRLFPLKR